MKALHLLLAASMVFALVALYPSIGAFASDAEYSGRQINEHIKQESIETPHEPSQELFKKPRLTLPKGWKSKGCGLGPPPESPQLSDLPECAEFVASYEQMCGSENGSPGLQDEYDGIKANRTAGDPAKYEGKYALLCYSQSGMGRPVYVLAGAVDSRDERTCGPPHNMFDVLDVRIEGNRSIEYGFVSTPVRWFKIISFRPIEATEYHIAARVHLQRQNKTNEGWEFKRKRGKRSLALLGSSKCPLSSCGVGRTKKAHFWCMTMKMMTVSVTKGNCTVPTGEDLPLCADSYPGEEDEWFGRWYKECNGDAGCLSTHPIRTRPLDGRRESIPNLRLLRAVGACGPSTPSKLFTRQFSHFVFNEKAGWVYHPHVCRPRIFTKNAAWRCLNSTGLLSVGDSVQLTNGHLLWLWMDLAPLGSYLNDTYFSVRGDRKDELFGTLGRGGDASNQKTYKFNKFFFYQIVRQRNFHLKDLATDLATLKAKQVKKDWNNNIKAVVMSIGLHDAVNGYTQPNQTDMVRYLKSGFTNLSYPVVFHPSPATSVMRMCTRKNPDRTWRVNDAYSQGFNTLYNLKVKNMPPVAVTPSFFMSRSMNWEVPAMDDSGTHPYCSFIGLAMWMQTLDLVCPMNN